MKQNWTYKKFSEVFNLQMGKTPSRDNLSYWGGDNIWVSIADMKGKYIDSTKEHITDIAVSESGIHKVPQGTAIMSFKLTIGRAAITKYDLFTNEAIMSFEPKDANILLPDYVFYYLKGCKWAGANKAVMGQTLNKKTISENIFAYPSLELQSRIVSELDLLQSIIDKQKAQLKEYDTLAQAVFYDMFGDLEASKYTLIELCDSKDDIKCGPFGTQLSKTEYQKSGVAVWGIPQINSHFKIPPSDYVSEEKAINLKDYSVIAGDIVMSRKGNVGQCCVFPKSFSSGIIHSDVLRLRLNPHKADSLFMMYQLHLSKNVKYQIQLVSSGAIMPGINVTKLKNIVVEVPPLPLQQSFAAKIESIEKQKAAISKSIAETEKLFEYTMDKYFG